MRFPHRERHQIFLEPEGLDVDEIYVNGFSMSLPADVQAEIVHALPGLEDAEILRPGYAVEYDFIQPTELDRALETQRVPRPVPRRPDQRDVRLRGGGGPGLVAGINAARSGRGRRRSCSAATRRTSASWSTISTTRGCLEPYRMFTSRAEHRLLLRIDNADLRLTPRGREIGLVDDERWERFEARRDRLERNREVVRERVGRSSGRSGCRPRGRCGSREVDLRALVGDVSLRSTSSDPSST